MAAMIGEANPSGVRGLMSMARGLGGAASASRGGALAAHRGASLTAADGSGCSGGFAAHARGFWGGSTTKPEEEEEEEKEGEEGEEEGEEEEEEGEGEEMMEEVVTKPKSMYDLANKPKKGVNRWRYQRKRAAFTAVSAKSR
jgi:hypothetical protein